MKKLIKNLITMTAISMSALAFNPTFAMESNLNTNPSTTNSQQIRTTSEQIENLKNYKLTLQKTLNVIEETLANENLQLNLSVLENSGCSNIVNIKPISVEDAKKLLKNQIDNVDNKIKTIEETKK